ncbi:formate dehydrogenase subunit delta [Novosphingobium sp.]|nr:formate dehydrogenase subunit delta [Novosphingobium sp.]HKR90705.1 formate dehydrogenase subunit delta [Novosphingobium sp.]
MMSTDERLAYMAGQILRNFASKGPEEAIAATTEHLAQFWDPSMKGRAFAMLDDSGAALAQDVREVFTRLREGQAAA